MPRINQSTMNSVAAFALVSLAISGPTMAEAHEDAQAQAQRLLVPGTVIQLPRLSIPAAELRNGSVPDAQAQAKDVLTFRRLLDKVESRDKKTGVVASRSSSRPKTEPSDAQESARHLMTGEGI